VKSLEPKNRFETAPVYYTDVMNDSQPSLPGQMGLWPFRSREQKFGRSPFSHLSHPNPNPNSYSNLTLTLNLTLT